MLSFFQVDREPLSVSKEIGAPRWIDQGEQVTIAGHTIDAGLFYFGRRDVSKSTTSDEISFVDTSLTVAPQDPDYSGGLITYWPSYASLHPRSRLAYLSWLAGGRKLENIHPAYILLYLSGLERRLVLERAEQDAHKVMMEVLRLATEYGHNSEVCALVDNLHDAAYLVHVGELPKVNPRFPSLGEAPSIGLKIAIARAIKSRDPIDPDWILRWAMSELSKDAVFPTGKALSDFKAAFSDYCAKYRPFGVRLIDHDAAPLSELYRAVNDGFSIPISSFAADYPDLVALPDIEKIPKVLAAATSLVKEALLACGYVGSSTGAPTIQSTTDGAPPLSSQLPESEIAQSSSNSALIDWARQRLDEGGKISFIAALKRFRGCPPKRLLQSEIEKLADELAQEGIGLVPDPRFDVDPIRKTEDALLFKLENHEQGFSQASDEYRHALLLVMTAMEVARADGPIEPDEIAVIGDIISANNILSPNEQCRLQAEVKWMRQRLLPLAPLFDAIGRLTDSQKKQIADAAIDVILADDLILETEKNVGATIFSALGYTEQKMNEALDSKKNAASTQSPVPVWNARKALARDEPAKDAPTIEDASPALRSQLSTIVTGLSSPEDDASDIETRAISIPNPPSSEGGVNSSTKHNSGACSIAQSFDGLDEKHSKFLDALLQQPEWSRNALDRIARQNRLMLDGALETINEWSFDTHDDALIEMEDDENIQINLEVDVRKNEALKGAA